MSFVGRKGNARPIRPAGYVDDDAAFSSGAGAIASIDGVTDRRRRARALAARVSRARDRRLATVQRGMGAFAMTTAVPKAQTTTTTTMLAVPGSTTTTLKVGSIIPTTEKYPGQVQVSALPKLAIDPATTLIGTAQPGTSTTTGWFHDAAGMTCLASAVKNGYCPAVPQAKLPPGGLPSVTTSTTPISTTSGGTSVPVAPSGGGGGGVPYDPTSASGGNTGIVPPSTPMTPVDVSELEDDASSGGGNTGIVPPSMSSTGAGAPALASLTANKPLLYAGAALVAWWLFFRKHK